MTTSAATLVPFCVSSTLDQASNWLARPSSLLIKQVHAPIWTSKYILAMHYSTHNAASLALLNEIKTVRCQANWQLAARVLWAASLILPLLDTLSWVCKKLACIDPQIKKRHQLIHDRQKLDIKAEQIQALGNSVRELALLFMVTSCKKEQDEGMNIEDLSSKRTATLHNFQSHFAKNQLNQALIKSCTLVLQLLDNGLGVKGTISAIRDDDMQNLLSNVGHTFQRLLQQVKTDPTSSWLKGENDSPVANELHYVMTRFVPLQHLCEDRYAHIDDSFRA